MRRGAVVPVRRVIRRDEIAVGGIAYPAAVAVGAPGPPGDHLFGDWWHVDLVRHLDGPAHGEPHTLACPLIFAHQRHLVLHGVLWPDPGPTPEEVGWSHA